MITILSSDVHLFAHVREVEEGIEVGFYYSSIARTGTATAPAKLLSTAIIDQPLHLVLDRVHAVLQAAPQRASLKLLRDGRAYC